MRIILCAALVAACGSPDPTPTVEVTSATPESLIASDDTMNDLTITVRYTDGDGDLGSGMAAIHDCRNDDLVTTLALPSIAPPDIVSAKDEISGELDLNVDDIGDQAAAAMPTACSDLGVAALAAGTTVFCVELTDAAGHTSGGSCTDAITIAD